MLDSIAEFFAMGGYARFVWSAYAVTFFVLFINLLVSRIEHRRLVSRLSLERQLDSSATTPATDAGASGEPSAVADKGIL